MIPEVDRLEKYEDLKTEKQRQGNDVEDFNDLPKEALQSQAKPEQPESVKPSPSEIIEKLYEVPPEPKFDPTIPEYQKRTAKLNAYTRGLSTLADAFAVGVGGNVVNQGPDRTTGRYIDNYFKYLDDYRKRKEDYDYRNWLNKMRAARTELGQANRDQERNDTNQYRNQQQENWEKSFDATQDYREDQNKRRDEEFAWEKQKYKEAPERQKEFIRFQEGLKQAREKDELDAWLAKETAKLQFDKAKNQYVLYSSDGKARAAVDDEGQIQKLYHAITSDPSLKQEADAMMEVLRAQLGEGITMNHMKIIVSKLWDRSDNARKFLGISSEPEQQSQWNTRPPYNGPLRHQDEQPQSKAEYSTGGYY